MGGAEAGVVTAAPAIGGRVRIRLSGECRQRWDGPHGRLRPHRYPSRENGRLGRVSEPWYDSAIETHRIMVLYDDPIEVGTELWWGGFYAPSELEPVGEGEP